MIRKIILNSIILAIVLTAGVADAKTKARLGQPIPDKVNLVKLSQILQNSSEYKDKEVVLEGNFAGTCCGGGFFYKEGFDVIEIYPKGFSNPRLIIGKPIKIYGIVRVIARWGVDMLYIEAKGLEIR